MININVTRNASKKVPWIVSLYLSIHRFMRECEFSFSQDIDIQEDGFYIQSDYWPLQMLPVGICCLAYATQKFHGKRNIPFSHYLLVYCKSIHVYNVQGHILVKCRFWK